MSKRKAYRPRAVMENPLAMMRPMSAAKVARLELYYLTAIASVASGKHPGPEEWRSIADLLNVTETIVSQGKLPRDEVLPDIAVASAALREAAARFKDGKGMRLSGPGLVALRSVVAVHQQCLEELTEREIEQAIAETRRAIIAIQRDRTSEVVTL